MNCCPDSYRRAQSGWISALEILILVMVAMIGGAFFMSYFFPEKTPGGKFKAACLAAGGVPVKSGEWICYEKGIVIPVDK